ncbi:hypothetical protein JNB91_23605 [Rhizobium wenxiniae]|nr:hypothetical protein [Rhizobium wenxiniae]
MAATIMLKALRRRPVAFPCAISSPQIRAAFFIERKDATSKERLRAFIACKPGFEGGSRLSRRLLKYSSFYLGDGKRSDAQIIVGLFCHPCHQ